MKRTDLIRKLEEAVSWFAMAGTTTGIEIPRQVLLNVQNGKVIRWRLGLNPHTEMLHAVTRYRRPDLGHLDIEVTVEDTGTFTKPWKIRTVWDLVQDDEIQEFICAENNKDVQHLR